MIVKETTIKIEGRCGTGRAAIMFVDSTLTIHSKRKPEYIPAGS